MNKLVLELLADSNGLIKGLNQAQSSLDKFTKAAGSTGSALGGGVNRALDTFKGLAGGGAQSALILAGAIVAVSGAAVAMTIHAGQQAEALQQLQTITGISTDTLQEYDVLMNRAGLTSEDLVTVMLTLSKNMEEAQSGTGRAADRFRQLGIDITKVTSTDDLIRKVADSLSKFANGTQKAAIEADLMGRGGLRLALAMEGGAKGMDEAARASVTLGAALSSGQLAELATMDDRIDDLTIAWKRFGQQIGSFVAPAIDFAAQALANLLSMASQGLKNLNTLGGVGGTPDDRKQPPALIDTAKQAAHRQGLLDAQFKSLETYHQDSLAVAKAANEHEMALLEFQKAFALKTNAEIGMAQMQAIGRLDAFTETSLTKQLHDYQAFIQKKRAAFTVDEKGLADLAKFNEEVGAKELSMITKIALAHQQADTNRIVAGRQVVTFWQKQLQDVVASNAFSVGLIVNTWTSGVANAIVNGGDFVKAAWRSTQIAVIQGGLNLAVQWAAQQALMATASSTAAGVTTGVWAGATTALTGFFATVTAAFATMFASLVTVVTAVGTYIMGVLSAIAKALSSTIFGIPFAGAILVGIALIAAALAATGNLGFKEGGIGDFGSGTQATLHGPEAVIPLNSRGAAFMQEAFGMGGGGREIVIKVPVTVDGRQIAFATARYTPAAWRALGAPA